MSGQVKNMVWDPNIINRNTADTASTDFSKIELLAPDSQFFGYIFISTFKPLIKPKKEPILKEGIIYCLYCRQKECSSNCAEEVKNYNK